MIATRAERIIIFHPHSERGKRDNKRRARRRRLYLSRQLSRAAMLARALHTQQHLPLVELSVARDLFLRLCAGHVSWLISALAPDLMMCWLYSYTATLYIYKRVENKISLLRTTTPRSKRFRAFNDSYNALSVSRLIDNASAWWLAIKLEKITGAAYIYTRFWKIYCPSAWKLAGKKKINIRTSG